MSFRMALRPVMVCSALFVLGHVAAAQTKGRERYDGFVEALGRRLARGRKLADEVSQDFAFDSKLDTTTNGT